MTTYRGPSILALLGLIFITLKLIGAISWSWWWVLAPFWLPMAAVFLFFGTVFLIALGGAIIMYKVETHNDKP